MRIGPPGLVFVILLAGCGGNTVIYQSGAGGTGGGSGAVPQGDCTGIGGIPTLLDAGTPVTGSGQHCGDGGTGSGCALQCTPGLPMCEPLCHDGCFETCAGHAGECTPACVGACLVECAEAPSCQAAVGPGSFVRCGAGSCQVDCRECEVDCASAPSCTVYCRGKGCVVHTRSGTTICQGEEH